MTQVGKRQQRFIDNTGERYLVDGSTVRCHGVGRSKIRRMREVQGDPDLTSDELWPEAQCSRAAIAGEYGCKYHPSTYGSLEVRKRNLHLIDYMPGTLRRKMMELVQNPNYIDRSGEIFQLLALNAELFESLQDDEMLGAGETWDIIENGVTLVERGEVSSGVWFIRDALESTRRKFETYGQVRENIKLVDRLTRTQVSTAKEMKNMATTEQIAALMERMFHETLASVDAVVDDDVMKRRLYKEIGRRYDLIASAGDSGTLSEIP